MLGGLFGLMAMLLPYNQVGLTVLGVSMMVAGFSACLASVLSMQVKRGFEELFYQQSTARRLIRTVLDEPLPAPVQLAGDLPADAYDAELPAVAAHVPGQAGAPSADGLTAVAARLRKS